MKANSLDLQFMKEAEAEARQGLSEGGIPIGSILVRGNSIVGRGHNQRVQKGSAISVSYTHLTLPTKRIV